MTKKKRVNLSWNSDGEGMPTAVLSVRVGLSPASTYTLARIIPLETRGARVQWGSHIRRPARLTSHGSVFEAKRAIEDHARSVFESL